jgi:glycosyltransferase involved in cell wall biosynthesis
LIEALAEIGTRHPQIRLSIVGKDVAGEKRRLAALAEQLGVSDKVIFKGFVSDEQLIREYQTADIFVHAARQEQFGVVLLEAMASGLPVIGANACGIPEIIPEDSLVPVDDPDALARKTIRFLSLTDEERWRMGERNRLIVIDSFTSHRQGDEVLRFLEEAIEKHDKPTG